MAESDTRDSGENPNWSDKPKYQPRYDNSYAIVIGIDTYKDPKLRPLGNAEDDALDINEVLSGDPYNFQVELLLGQQATRQAITRALNKIIGQSHADDRVIFYFAGHGYIVQNNRGFDIGYLACADTDPDDPFDGLEYDEVIKLTQFTKAKHIAFILDACYSGNVLGLTRAAMQTVAVQEYLLHTSYQVLTAGAVEVVSDTRSMTGELIKALKVGIPNHDGPVTFDDLGKHVHHVIHNQSKGRQSPICSYLEGSGKGQMVLVPFNAIDAVPVELRQGLTHLDPLMRRFAISEAEKHLADLDKGDWVRAVLEEMEYDDENRDVRRRAGEALRNVPKAVIAKPETTSVQRADSTSLPKEQELESSKIPEQKQTSSAPIQDIVPAPFEWCNIPAGRVTLEEASGTFDVKPFKMSKYPITYAQYQIFIDANDGFAANRWWSDLEEIGAHSPEQNWKIANHPRENVSWYAAIAYCRWISYRLGYEVRLPTEWEWQWAAQGPDGREYPWGNEYIQGYANIDEESSKIKNGVYLGKTTPVDYFPQGASPFGVMDMSGNVWEWCLNKFNKPDNISTAGNAPRVVCGGSWYGNQMSARCASRYYYLPTFVGNYLGFRVVLLLANPDS